MKYEDQVKEHDKWSKDEESPNTFTLLSHWIRKKIDNKEAYEICGVTKKEKNNE